MHPQDSDRQEVCKEFFLALQTCHGDSWSYWTGGCNRLKNELNMCLRKERLRRAEANREDAKMRRERANQAWNTVHEDD